MMNLIFNTLLLCHVLDSSLSYMMYQTMLGLNGFLENSGQVQSSRNSNSDESQSYSGGSYNKYKHRSDPCRNSRKRCNCVKCGSTRSNCCEDFCQKYCSPNVESYMSPSEITPGVLVMPYPVPMVLVASTSQTTSEDLNPKNVSDGTTTTFKISSSSDKLRYKDEPELPGNLPEIDDQPAQPCTVKKMSEIEMIFPPRRELRNNDMEYGTSKYKGHKRFSIITPPNRRKMNNPVPKAGLKSLPKYGLVSIPQVLLSMIKELKAEKKTILEEKQKLLHFYKKSKLPK